jgi:hypothetical protein
MPTCYLYAALHYVRVPAASLTRKMCACCCGLAGACAMNVGKLDSCTVVVWGVL